MYQPESDSDAGPYTFLGEALKKSVSTDSKGYTVDTFVANKLFQYYCHLHQRERTPNEKTLFDILEVSEKPETEDEKLRFLTAMNISAASTVDMRLYSVVGKVIMKTLPLILKASSRYICSKLLTENQISGDWFEAIDSELMNNSATIDTAGFANSVLGNRVKMYYDLARKGADVTLQQASPLQNLLSQIMEQIASMVAGLAQAAMKLK
ncbi:hypothetical protein HDE_12918 [Halotydeus destructor]|nr:hypothetical protein HDE_12918 [Halotydeus destructor]